MKRIATVTLLALATLSQAADPITIHRIYFVGQNVTYKFTAHVEGQKVVDSEAEVSQMVVKVFKDGSADMVTSIANAAIRVGGRISRLNSPPAIFGRYDSTGRSLTNTPPLLVLGFDVVELLGLRPQQAVSVGEPSLVRQIGVQSLRSRASGSMSLRQVQGGIAQFDGNFQMAYSGQPRPVSTEISVQFDLGTGQLLTMQGQMANVKIPGSQTASSPKFTLARV